LSFKNLKTEGLVLKNEGKTIFFQQDPQNETISFTYQYLSLFHHRPLEIYYQGKILGKIYLKPKLQESKKMHLVDYSCSRYSLDFTGMDDSFLSVGCLATRKGSVGSEKNILEVVWISPGLMTEEGSHGPFITTFYDQAEAKFQLKDLRKLNTKKVTLKAGFPVRANRLGVALGFGPYAFKTIEKGKKHETWAFPVMLYSNFYLTPETSIRNFDAFLWNESWFNNFGMYFAYKVGEALDGTFEIVPLLGFQLVSFHSKETRETFHEFLFPQGFEIVYKHAFGIKNNTFVYGMFFSPVREENYLNLWVRLGTKVFWELNYIRWEKNDKFSDMWGLSVGIPLGRFF